MLGPRGAEHWPCVLAPSMDTGVATWMHWWARFATWHFRATRWLSNTPSEFRHFLSVLTAAWCCVLTVLFPMLLQFRQYHHVLLTWLAFLPVATLYLRHLWRRFMAKYSARRDVRYIWQTVKRESRLALGHGRMFYQLPDTQQSRFAFTLVSPIIPWYQKDDWGKDGRYHSAVPKEVTLRILYWLVVRERCPWTARVIFKYHLAATGRGRWTPKEDIVQAYKRICK